MLTLQVGANKHSNLRVCVMNVPHISNLACPHDICLPPRAREGTEGVPRSEAELEAIPITCGTLAVDTALESSDGETRGSLASAQSPPELPAHLHSLTSNLKAVPALVLNGRSSHLSLWDTETQKCHSHRSPDGTLRGRMAEGH